MVQNQFICAAAITTWVNYSEKKNQQQKPAVISQKFHNERAVYLARKNGIEAIGYNAKTPWQSKRLRIREYLAKVKAVLDINVLKTKPKFLGEKIEIAL